jgi:glycosyltransferase involved in cell wall biosynthesis
MMHFGFDESQLPIVPNCVDHSLYVPPLNKKTTGYTIGYLGRLNKYKSADHLLRAFHILKKEMPELKLVIVGDGDARGGLEILANELGIADSVTFAGYVTEKVKVELLHTMDFIVNSSAKEGWGLTVIEANACGVPVIASNVQGLKDSVIHEKTGLLYPYGDISKLVNSMRTLLLNKKVRDNCAAEALKWAQTFDWEQSASKMLAAMESVIRNKH